MAILQENNFLRNPFILSIFTNLYFFLISAFFFEKFQILPPFKFLTIFYVFMIITKKKKIDPNQKTIKFL